MEENVIISIKGSQLYEGQDPDVTELVTAGTLRREQEGYTIAYQETELTGLEGTTTKLRIEGPRVTLLRLAGKSLFQLNVKKKPGLPQ